jgi:hypothetical protein
MSTAAKLPGVAAFADCDNHCNVLFDETPSPLPDTTMAIFVL